MRAEREGSDAAAACVVEDFVGGGGGREGQAEKGNVGFEEGGDLVVDGEDPGGFEEGGGVLAVEGGG